MPGKKNYKMREELLTHIKELLKTTTRIENGVPVFVVPDLYQTGLHKNNRFYYTLTYDLLDMGALRIAGTYQDKGRPSARLYTLAENVPTITKINHSVRPLMAKAMKKLEVFTVADLVSAGAGETTVRNFVRECMQHGFIELHRKEPRYRGRGGSITLYRITEKVTHAGR